MKYNIPLFKLNFDGKEASAALETVHSGWISSGPKTIEFENQFARMLGVDYSLATANCTVALHMAMKLLNIGKDDEVLCPSLTFVATCNAIRYVDAVPVFVDVASESDLTIDLYDLECKISTRTKAIVVMHYGGFACRMNEIIALARKHNLKVIEDACHAPFSEYEGRKLGTFGDIGCFSFFSNKNISTGEGGMLVTSDPDIYERAKLLRSHGMTTMSYDRSTGHSTSYDVVEHGFNYRFDDIRASIGLIQLSKIQSDLEQREKVRDRYLSNLIGVEELSIPFHDNSNFVSNYIFVVVLKNSDVKRRDLVRADLAKLGIQTSVHYPAVHRFRTYENFSSRLPRTEYISDNTITLPMYSSLTFDEIDYISQSLIDVLGAS